MAVKTGMLFSAPIIEQIAEELSLHRPTHLVVDPVMISTSGTTLIAPDAIQCMVNRLFPLSELVTPNTHEAQALTAPIMLWHRHLLFGKWDAGTCS